MVISAKCVGISADAAGTSARATCLPERGADAPVCRAGTYAGAFFLLLAACGPPPVAQKAPPKDETKEPWYAEAVNKLTADNTEAAALLKRGKEDDASALVQSGEKIAARLLGVPHPTLSAMQAASDVDELYGKMLLANKNYGWARLFFQKNLARWKVWVPETPDTIARRSAAAAEIADVDRRMTE